MMKTMLTVLCALLLTGCGEELSGSYKMVITLPSMRGLAVSAAQRAQLEGVVNSQQVTLEFSTGKKVTMKHMGMGTEASYEITGNTLKIMMTPNQFMELTIDGDTLVGPGGVKYVKQ